ncbi:MAG: F0F1 ATP synthase subunit alpha [Anaerolineae bacterium]|nr:F0F1 ATP synthase subunit alpha [Anaerolineae bacterium]
MPERSRRPDVALLLRELHEQTEGIDRQGRLPAADLVRHLSRTIAALPGLHRARFTINYLSDELRRQVQQIEPGVRLLDVGTVQHIGEGVATLSGLPRARTEELVTFPTGAQGMVLNLDHTQVDVILLDSEEGIQGGDLVVATGERLQVPVGHLLLGRVVNPLGRPLDNRGSVEAAAFDYLEQEAPGIVSRTPVNEPLHTGSKVIDALVPIGRGQRELILGDRQSGKTTMAVDAILSQRDSGVACVYVAVGQKKSTVLAVIETLRRNEALAHTIVVMASPNDPPALRYLAPYAGCTMAEFLTREGRDVMIVYDDLTKHADAYRELSLLLRRTPGREAYPGDIFYLHARLLERACKLNEASGGGSLTALPIIETQRGNVSAYIPTNLISITDGQIVLDSALFNRGIKPAVNVGRSVSRVGGAAQTHAMRAVSGPLRLEMAQYEEVAAFARFGADVDEATRHQIRRGQRLQAALGQPAHQPLSLDQQIAVLLSATQGFLDDVDVADVPRYEQELYTFLERNHLAFCYQLDRTCEMSDELHTSLLAAIADFHQQWHRRNGNKRSKEP